MQAVATHRRRCRRCRRHRRRHPGPGRRVVPPAWTLWPRRDDQRASSLGSRSRTCQHQPSRGFTRPTVGRASSLVPATGHHATGLSRTSLVGVRVRCLGALDNAALASGRFLSVLQTPPALVASPTSDSSTGFSTGWSAMRAHQRSLAVMSALPSPWSAGLSDTRRHRPSCPSANS